MTETGPHVLVVDDEESNLEVLKRVLGREGYRISVADSGPDGLDRLREDQPELLLTDLKMPGMDGLELLRAARTVSPATEVILMTAFGTVEIAVEAMREGAYDFITKPLKRHDILKAVGKGLEKAALLAENRLLREQIASQTSQSGSVAGIVGRSEGLRQVLETAGQVAPSEATVLIVGESGTGKEVLAQAIHELSGRSDGPLIRVNCAAIPETLFESELFGYEKGAFTGAADRKPGRFELADGGTLFLDEVAEMSMASQVKLLRVLQEGQFERVGGTTTLSVDIRLIAATNRDLERAVAQRSFREDLFYRLNVIPIQLPPLRERADDVPLLAAHFVKIYREKNHKAVKGISDAALAALTAYRWPGNIRELENTMERAVVLCRTDHVGLDDLPQHMQPEGHGGPRQLVFPMGTPLREIEKTAIRETLRHTSGDKKLAARLLGIAARTIYRRLEETREQEDGSAEGVDS
ncbi:MAG TPA: DNA-binding response regulator [Deltaproteobacteria bacterium]|nr:DNA-binding response regulator [Deltaproteobacteria bacterium]HCP48026.1 DNA-binding response regulator [Deltaproteobacteria bacterium]